MVIDNPSAEGDNNIESWITVITNNQVNDLFIGNKMHWDCLNETE